MLAAQPAMTPFQSASLYVGDLHPEVTESVLFELFNRVGPVASIRVCRDSMTRRSLGYAYVNFHNVQDAERALDTMNFSDIQGRPCRIMWSQRDPSLRKTGLGNVFVRNLAPSVDNKGLYDTFSVFGNILSCKVAMDENGKSKGYGYVHFETGEAATDAIQKFDGMLIDDVEVHVGHFVRRADRASQNVWTNLYVKQFPTKWEEAQLREMFAPFGNIASVFISRDADNKSKGFGFVNFEEHEAAAQAVAELNGKAIEDTKEDGTPATLTLYVGKAQKKVDRLREIKLKQEKENLERINKFQGMNLYVKNIADDTTDDLFREAFAPFGTITSARIMREANEAKTSKGFGFVCYSTAEAAAKAVAEMNGKTLAGKPLYVTFYQKKDQRRAQFAAGGLTNPQNMRFNPNMAAGVPMPFMYGMPQGQMPQMGAGPRGGMGYPRSFQNNARGAPNAAMGGAAPRGGPNMGFAGGAAGAFYPQMAGPYGQMQPGQVPPQQQQGGYKPRGQPQGQPPAAGPGSFQGQMPGQMAPQYAPREPARGPMGPGGPQQMGQPQQGGAPMPRGMPQMGPGGAQQPTGGMMPRGPAPAMYGQPGAVPGMNMNMMPPQFQQQQGMPRGAPAAGVPAGVKFTNQARNQNGQPMPGMMMGGPMGAMGGVPQQPQQASKMDFSEALLATTDPAQQKNMIGEKLYPLIHARQPEQAGKITGMLLEMDNGELLNLIESPEALMSKIEEALIVLRNHKII
jgi:polyadenylate-binding protein